MRDFLKTSYRNVAELMYGHPIMAIYKDPDGGPDLVVKDVKNPLVYEEYVKLTHAEDKFQEKCRLLDYDPSTELEGCDRSSIDNLIGFMYYLTHEDTDLDGMVYGEVTRLHRFDYERPWPTEISKKEEKKYIFLDCEERLKNFL
jgi:hypothetical protein